MLDREYCNNIFPSDIIANKKRIKGKRCGLSTALDTLFLMARIINKEKWLIVAFLPLWYNIQRCRTQSGNRKGVYLWRLLYPFWFPLWQA